MVSWKTDRGERVGARLLLFLVRVAVAVIVCVGVVADPVDDAGEGTFLIATSLYARGWDVHMYDEDLVIADGSGDVYDEIVDAVQDRKVDRIAIFGFSHGGGSTYDLSELIETNEEEIGTFTMPFTAYTDGVENDSDTDMEQENRRPPLSDYHANYYQHGTLVDAWLDGGPIDPPEDVDREIDVEQEPEGDPWDPNATHFTIDNLEEVRGEIQQGLETEVTTR